MAQVPVPADVEEGLLMPRHEQPRQILSPLPNKMSPRTTQADDRNRSWHSR